MNNLERMSDIDTNDLKDILLDRHYLTENVIKDLFATILISMDSETYSEENFVDDMERFMYNYGIQETLPLNLQIQISIGILSFYSCFFCSSGSLVIYELMELMVTDIRSCHSKDFLIDFVITLKQKLPSKSCKNIKKYLIILYYVEIYELYYYSKDKSFDVNLNSTVSLKAFINKIKNEICLESVITIVFLLIVVSETFRNSDINWIITCIDECIIMDNISKYNIGIKAFPLFFSVLNIYAESQTFHYSFLSVISLISCAIICSKSSFFSELKCINFKLELQYLSRYDIIYFLNIKKYFEKHQEEKFFRLKKEIDTISEQNEDLRSLIYRFFRKCDHICDKLIISYFDGKAKKNIPDRRIIQNHHDDHDVIIYDNIFSGTFVYLNNIKDHVRFSPIFTFVCEINTDIGEFFQKDDTVLIKGPLFFEQIRKTRKNSFGWANESFFKLNYYIECLKSFYFLKYVKNIKPPQIVRIKNTNVIRQKYHDHHNEKNIRVDRHIRKNQNMIKTSDNYNFMFLLSEKVNFDHCDFLVCSDPFDDYRKKPWSFDVITLLNHTIPFYKMKVEENVSSADNLFFMYKKFILSDQTSANVFKKIYIYLIFQALFGIKHIKYKDCSIVDFNLIIDKKTKKINIQSSFDSKFSELRYPVYFEKNRKRLALNFSHVDAPFCKLKPSFKEVSFEKRKEVFEKEFHETIIPLINEIYDFLENAKEKIDPVPGYLERKIKRLNIKNMYSPKYRQFSLASFDSNSIQNYTIIGTLSFAVSKILNLDSNIFGVDILFLKKYMQYNSISIKKKRNVYFQDLFFLWAQSIAKNTSFFPDFEFNSFAENYDFSFIETKRILPPISIFKGWIFQSPNNIEKMKKAIIHWRKAFIFEKKEMNKFNDSKKELNYNIAYIPETSWIENDFLPQIIVGTNNYLKMYQELEQKKYLNFCEFHFGYDFLQSYLFSLKYVILKFYKDYKKRIGFIERMSLAR